MVNLKVTIAFNDNSDSLNERCPLRSEKMYRQDIVGGGKVVVTVETEKPCWNSRGASKRGKVRWRSFALMSVGARHSIRGRVMAHRRQAHAYQKRTRDKRDEEVAFSTSETIRTVLRSSRTHKRGERNGSCSCALPRALRCSTLFGYDFTGPRRRLLSFSLSPSLFFTPLFTFPLFFFSLMPLFPPTLSTLWLSSSSHERHPSFLVLVHGRGDTYARILSWSRASTRTTGLVTCTLADSQLPTVLRPPSTPCLTSSAGKWGLPAKFTDWNQFDDSELLIKFWRLKKEYNSS